MLYKYIPIKADTKVAVDRKEIKTWIETQSILLLSCLKPEL